MLKLSYKPSFSIRGIKMVRSSEVINKIQNTLPSEDWKYLESVFAQSRQTQGRRSRKSLISEINSLMIDIALKNNKPSLLYALPDFPGSEIDELFSKIGSQFIKTHDETWLNCLLVLSNKLGKKSYQSRVYASIALSLIDAGVTDSNSFLINHGIGMLDRVIFRKYRSDIMIDIVPLLIVWAINTLDEKILYSSLKTIEEISDISKKAVLHAELAKAIATISVLKKNKDLYLESLKISTKIRQKIRRHDCIFTIIEKGAKSAFGKEMSDIPLFIANFHDVPQGELLEITSALAAQLLERVKDKNQLIEVLEHICRQNPQVSHTIITDLLKKAERTGDGWYLSSAIRLHEQISFSDAYPIREMIRAGIAVARFSKNMQVLKDLIPIVIIHCDPDYLSRTYLQFSEIMLVSGDFSSALEIFMRISRNPEISSSYNEGLTNLLKASINSDRIQIIGKEILLNLDDETVQTVIHKTSVDICKEQEFGEIISHISSIKELVSFHPKRDQLFVECITILINRGFLDKKDPGFLIDLIDSIEDSNLKERAISNIVIKIARIGVQTRNRDFLQRAVGLTCAIEGQNIRSITLSSIIDEASVLASQDGDLDLLLRMREWSSSLLEKDLAAYAMANIIEGILKYAIGRHSTDAVEKASGIAEDIDDPALKTQMFERIAECFVKVGCISLKEDRYTKEEKDFQELIYPFKKGLEIIKRNVKSSQISLKIAAMIDIMISFSRETENPDYIIAFAMYSVEIKNSFERDAMLHRVISNLHDDTLRPNSTDPYEIVSFLLQNNPHTKGNPDIIRLTYEFADNVSDPYVKLTGFCSIADLSIRSGDLDTSNQILETIQQFLPTLSAEYEKIIILSDLAMLFCYIDKEKAKLCLQKGIDYLSAVEPDKEGIARTQIIMAVESISGIDPDKKWNALATQISAKISDPFEYIQSLIAIHDMNSGDKARRVEILREMVSATGRIVSPYDKIMILLRIFPFAQNDCEDNTPFEILKTAKELTRKININYISDTILDNISGILISSYYKNNRQDYLTQAIDVTKAIDDDEIRIRRLIEAGYHEQYDSPPPYLKIRNLAEKVISNGAHSGQVSTLERLIRTVADRGKEAVFFCDCAILFKKEGEEKLSKRMLQCAIKEARIIRPLSRRAYVMCDIAMKISAAGCEKAAQEILDLAIDAATNIRQSSIRDEVFDELGLAIKIIQEM